MPGQGDGGRTGVRTDRPGGVGEVGLRPAASVLAVAGAVWWGVAGGAVVPGAAATAAWVLTGVAVGVLVLVVARRRLSSEGAHEAMEAGHRSYGRVNLAQVVGIGAVVVLAGRSGVPQWIPVGITAVFGLHFLPFARTFRWRGYTWLALALLLVAAGGAALAAGGTSASGVHALVGPGVACVLWGAVLLAARRRGPHRVLTVDGAPTPRDGRGSVSP